ncbi:MAG: dephospho-CoA kinase [Betaproteobacteria bacterium]|nr:dephospho-CoA kinase [Betaproteobacteria bacterium]
MTEAASGFIVGLTGGIGSGKTAAADMFAELGAAVVDADQIAHELTAPNGAAMAEIRRVFGASVIAADGALDRLAMRRLAFSDADAKLRLEGILHPLIRAESQHRCEAGLANGAPYVILVVPLLVESGTYRSRVARVLVVDCAEATQVRRVMARNRMSSEEVRCIMATQATRAQRMEAADDSVDNDSDLDGLRRQIAALHQKYLSLAENKLRTS